MRITVSVLGIASTALWGCSDDVSKEDLTKQVANIKKKYGTKLHDLETAALDGFGDFAGSRSSDRRFYKKALKSAYGDAKKPITEDEIRAAIAELQENGGDAATEAAALAMLQQFQTIDDEQNMRLGAGLRAAVARKKELVARKKGVSDKLVAIEAKFKDLIDFEEEMIAQVDTEEIKYASDSKFFNELLDSIYGDKLKFKPVTKKEVEDMLTKTNGKLRVTSRLLGDLRDGLDNLTEVQRKRAKGWFKYIERDLERLAAKQKAN